MRKELTYTNGRYYGEVVNGKWHGKGKYTWNNGDSYEGDFLYGERTGKGRFVWTNGDVYEGDFVSGELMGKGRYIWANGNVYEGDYVRGERTGKGRCIWANGDVYEGDFVSGERTGKGSFVWTNGDVYEGDFVSGELMGKGRYIWADGGVYEGDFVSGERTGKGRFVWTNGDVYEGDFVSGERTGKGRYIWANGNVYDGDFVSGKKTGRGKLTQKNGSVYKGEFLEGSFHGKGAEYFMDGTLIRSGTWNKGVFQPDIPKSVPEYAEHYFLRARGKGNTSMLKGSIMFLLIPVTCEKWLWTDAAQENFSREFYKAKACFEKEAVDCGVKLQISLRQYEKPKDVNKIVSESGKDEPDLTEIKDEVVRQLLESYEAANLEEVEAVLKHKIQQRDKLKIDDVAFIIACNCQNRSFASRSAGSFRNEICIVFRNSRKFDYTTIMHEVSHLFGAVDYYYPEPEVPKKSAKYLGKNIMDCCGDKIDDLTKYLIGFTDTLSPAARAFLDATAHLTEKEIEAGRK